MKILKLLVLEGDGIGPEITQSTIEILEETLKKTRIKFELIYDMVGFESLKKYKTTIRNEIFEKAKDCQGIILGPVSHNEYPPTNEGGLNPSGVIRKTLDLYANIRPAKNKIGDSNKFKTGIDLVVVRENTEGFYSDRNMFLGNGEFMPTPDVALSLRKITRSASMRISEVGFQIASDRRKKITVVHKANVLRMSDGLFLECAREVAKKYPEVNYNEELVDAMSAKIIRDPSQFDVVLTTNLFGDNLSDAASEIAGSLGMAPSINTSDDYVVAQAQHGSAPDIAGKNLANPCSLIGSVSMMLDWIGKKSKENSLIEAGSLIQNSIDKTIANSNSRTKDLGGNLSTTNFTKIIIDNL
jgi:isocitrate/isopropylmalate dehydrogenase